MESGAKNMDLAFPKEAYQTVGSESICLRHEPCPSCGSKDNLARYDDGHAFCFSIDCDHYEHSDRSSSSRNQNKPKKNTGAFTPIGGEFKEISKRKYRNLLVGSSGIRLENTRESLPTLQRLSKTEL